ncbi:hypothetical protein DVA86_32165 [Streptomyces armeniacus]|uniref:DUF4097 domain-containing protein n=1 Tax=Streptomyces armeniacus TaxID=83291 RepID=A0A345XY26_9ACTN|nr:DUF4097 family beta strand repeat-containing protein [Streptomyces armeniacus]AXK36542.1 hypothetical protein DVA86_32165 [Streptomyces armeniacus]
MPSFDTPEPIAATLEFDAGHAWITAGERTDTEVEVLPADDANEADVRAAEQTRVTCDDGRLQIRATRKGSLFGKLGSVAVYVGLPTGSHVQGTASLADFTCEGRLGDCRLKTSIGDLDVEESASAQLRTGHGDIRLGRAAGDAAVTGAGRIRLGEVAGAATVKNANGDTAIGEVTGELWTSASNGRISVGVASAGVSAKSSNGRIRVGEVARGTVTLHTAAGDVEVGVRESTVAWLDVSARTGHVRNSLGASEAPGASDETVEVHARTGLGDIVIHRA